MSCSFDCSKYFLENIIIFISLFSFFVFFILTNEKKENYKEYTSVWKVPLNLYIFFILSFMLFNSLFPKKKIHLITKYCKILESQKMKSLILLLLATIFFASNNLPQLLQGIFFFLSGLFLIIIEYIFDCSILKNEKKKIVLNQNNSMNVSINEEKNNKEKNNVVNSNINHKDNPYNIPEDF